MVRAALSLITPKVRRDPEARRAFLDLLGRGRQTYRTLSLMNEAGVLPRFVPDGSVNALHFQRLKDKLGNRSNASSEVEFDNAYASRIGDEGAGIRTILPMVQLTRLDCAISSAGMMRAAVSVDPPGGNGTTSVIGREG